MFQFISDIDIQVLLFIQQHVRTPFLTPAVTLVTSLGNAGMIWILVSLLLLVPRKTRKAGCMSLLALVFSLLANNLLLKNLVHRMRPYDYTAALLPLVPKPVDFSFPSGHTGSSFASAFALYHGLPRRAGGLFFILAALIGLSRLYVGVHYPTDVLAGTVTGILSGWASVQVFRRMGRDGYIPSY